MEEVGEEEEEVGVTRRGDVEIFDQLVTPTSAKDSIHFSFAGRLNNFPSKTVELLATDYSSTNNPSRPKCPHLHFCQTMGDQSTVVCSRIYHQNCAAGRCRHVGQTFVFFHQLIILYQRPILVG